MCLHSTSPSCNNHVCALSNRSPCRLDDAVASCESVFHVPLVRFPLPVSRHLYSGLIPSILQILTMLISRGTGDCATYHGHPQIQRNTIALRAASTSCQAVVYGNSSSCARVSWTTLLIGFVALVGPNLAFKLLFSRSRKFLHITSRHLVRCSTIHWILNSPCCTIIIFYFQLNLA